MGPLNRSESREFVEALARGIEVIRCFDATHMEMTVSEVAARTGLARPTARRLLMTLEQLGYMRSADGVYALTAKTLELGTAYISALGVWDIARPHMQALVDRTRESTSMSQLDGSDVVYVARVAVPKIIAISVSIGTRFPAVATSMGRVLLAALAPDELDAVLDTPSASGVLPRVNLDRAALTEALDAVRTQGWALSDEQLSVGIRSIAVPVTGADGRVAAAMNVTVHAAETSVERLLDEHLPLLLDTARAVSVEWSHLARLPAVRVAASGSTGVGRGQL
jgi:IclR family pca regulon transcriptional regulator